MIDGKHLFLLFLFTICGPAIPVFAQVDQPPIVGRWDLTLMNGESRIPAWMEIQKSGDRTLVGRFVGWVGSARPISKVEFAGDLVRFSIPAQWERGEKDLYLEGTLKGEQLTGSLITPSGTRRLWTAKRSPTLRNERVPKKWGKRIKLFSGGDMSRWQTDGPQWTANNGVLTNAKAGPNLVSRQNFTDFKLHIEFRYLKGANSGVYLRGRYEVQILDSIGLEPASDHAGAIYGFLAPNKDATKNPGEWQTFDITLVGRLVTVVLNGFTVICSQEIPGITGGALDSDEGAPGPILLQGDHGPIEFRNIVIRPAKQ